MFPVTGSYEEDDVNNTTGGLALPPAAVRNREIPPDERAVSRIANIVGHLNAPSREETGRPWAGKTTLGPVEALTEEQIRELESDNKALETLQAQLRPVVEPLKDIRNELRKGPLSLDKLESIKLPDFPNPALEAVTAGCNQERVINQKIKDHIKTVQSHQTNIKKLQTLTSMLNKYKEGDEISQEMKDLFKDLNDQKIELGKGDEKAFNKEKIGDIKALIREHQETIRTNIQIIFTTEIQVLIQTVTAILDCVKEIIRINTNLIRAANRRQGQG